jgi:hypothetical protein
MQELSDSTSEQSQKAKESNDVPESSALSQTLAPEASIAFLSSSFTPSFEGNSQ